MAENILRNIKVVAKTDVGMVRSENQDSYGIFEGENCNLYFVADGMGGARGGATASKLAVESITGELKANDKVFTERIVEIVKNTNKKIFESGSSNPELYGMGTTLVGLCFVGQKMIVLNVGDSRAYRIRAQHIKQLTVDHTLVGELVRAGTISEDSVENHPVSHMLTRSLGPNDKIEVDCGFGDNPQPLDQYLLCSDGLYNYVQDYEMAKILNQNSPEVAIENLINLANSRMCNDNVTVVLVTITEKYQGIINKKKDQISITDTVKLGEEQAKIAVIPKSSYYLLWGTLFSLIAIIFGLLLKKDSTVVKEPEIQISDVIHQDNMVSVNEDLLNRKNDLELELERLTTSIKLFDKTSDQVNLYFSEVKSKQLEIDKKISEISVYMEFLTNKLSVWINRKKRFTPESAINMAGEIAPFSEKVSSVKKKRDDISHEYLNVREDLSYQPHNDELAKKKDRLANEIKEYSEIVSSTVKKVIDEKISESERELSKGSEQRAEYRQKALQIEQDGELLKIIVSQNSSEILAKKMEIENKIKEIKSELADLNDIIASKK